MTKTLNVTVSPDPIDPTRIVRVKTVEAATVLLDEPVRRTNWTSVTFVARTQLAEYLDEKRRQARERGAAYTLKIHGTPQL